MGTYVPSMPPPSVSKSESIWTWSLAFCLGWRGDMLLHKHKKSFILHKNQMGIFFHRWELHSSRNNFLHLDGVVSTVLNWLLGSSAELVAGQFGRVGTGPSLLTRWGHSLWRMRKKEKDELLYSTHKLWRLRVTFCKHTSFDANVCLCNAVAVWKL